MEPNAPAEDPHCTHCRDEHGTVRFSDPREEPPANGVSAADDPVKIAESELEHDKRATKDGDEWKVSTAMTHAEMLKLRSESNYAFECGEAVKHSETRITTRFSSPLDAADFLDQVDSITR